MILCMPHFLTSSYIFFLSSIVWLCSWPTVLSRIELSRTKCQGRTASPTFALRPSQCHPAFGSLLGRFGSSSTVAEVFLRYKVTSCCNYCCRKVSKRSGLYSPTQQERKEQLRFLARCIEFKRFQSSSEYKLLWLTL